jgi:hypothetical protein
MSEMSQAEYYRIINRQRRLPEQLERARARVIQLEREAERLSMLELLTNQDKINEAWGREVELSRIQGASRG